MFGFTVKIYMVPKNWVSVSIFFFMSCFHIEGQSLQKCCIYQKTKRNSSNILFSNSKTSLVCLWYFGFFKTVGY